jgi:hypothetical protein
MDCRGCAEELLLRHKNKLFFHSMLYLLKKNYKSLALKRMKGPKLAANWRNFGLQCVVFIPNG